MAESILVTGATGFLGSQLIRSLVARQHPLIILKRSTSSMDRLADLLPHAAGQIRFHDIDILPLDAAFEARDVRLVLHCATRYASDFRDSSKAVEANLVFPLKLIDCCVKHSVNDFVNIDTMIRSPVSPYALSKLQFAQWLHEYASEHMNVTQVLIEHFYGVQDSPSKFIPFVVRNLVDGVDRLALTPGMQRRDFIFITDVVDAVMRIIDHALLHPQRLTEYQIGTRQTLTIRQIVELIKTLSGNQTTHLDFGALPYRKHELMNVQVDNQSLLALGWSPKVTLNQGLALMIEAQKLARNQTP
jgi:nucleoside-diphosphate-sugar epimerase